MFLFGVAVTVAVVEAVSRVVEEDQERRRLNRSQRLVPLSEATERRHKELAATHRADSFGRHFSGNGNS